MNMHIVCALLCSAIFAQIDAVTIRIASFNVLKKYAERVGLNASDTMIYPFAGKTFTLEALAHSFIEPFKEGVISWRYFWAYRHDFVNMHLQDVDQDGKSSFIQHTERLFTEFAPSPFQKVTTTKDSARKI